MFARKLKVKSVSDVILLVDSSNHCDFQVDIVSGRYLLNAKSIMSVFCVDLSQILNLQIHTDDEDAVKEFDYRVKRLIA